MVLIGDISRRTNLLALNAGVEAARAGDAGCGFAVVATELHAMAQRSGNAAKDIEDLINQSSEHVSEGVTLVRQADTTLQQIAGEISNVDDVLRSLANGSRAQSEALQTFASEIAQLEVLADRNGQVAEETSNSARETTAISARLTQWVEDFDVGADASAAPQSKVA